MSKALDRLNFNEVIYFYKSPDSFADYGSMQSFSLIRSTVEVFAYYGTTAFTAEDIRSLFEQLQIVQKKYNRVFLPSVKKISGVMECCFQPGINQLAEENGVYRIISWDSSGYGYEIATAKRKGKLPDTSA